MVVFMCSDIYLDRRVGYQAAVLMVYIKAVDPYAGLSMIWCQCGVIVDLIRGDEAELMVRLLIHLSRL